MTEPCPICGPMAICDHMGWEYDPDKRLAEVRMEPETRVREELFQAGYFRSEASSAISKLTASDLDWLTAWIQSSVEAAYSAGRAALELAIDTSDIPETTDWSKAERGKFYQKPTGRATVVTAREDCKKALVKLAAVGVSTPAEGYGTNSSWAISDLCRALASAAEREKELREALKGMYDGCPECGSAMCDHDGLKQRYATALHALSKE